MKRSYSKAYKISACEAVVNGGEKVSVVAERLGVGSVMLHRWVKEFKTFGENAFVGTGNLRGNDIEYQELLKQYNQLMTTREILYKSLDVLNKKPGEKVAFAKRELTEYKVTDICRALDISRGEYYRKPKPVDAEAVAKEAAALEEAVVSCFHLHKGNYGRKRIAKELQSKGIFVGEQKVSSILKKNGLWSKYGVGGEKVVENTRDG